MVSNDQLLTALRILARADRDDLVRLIRSEQFPVPVRARDSARNMIGLCLDHVSGQQALFS